MKVLLVLTLLLVLAAASATEGVFSAIKKHSALNPQFAELEAAVLNAAEAKEDAPTGRSAMAEVVSMVDMMIIQVNNEMSTLSKNHKKYQASCTKNLENQAGLIAHNTRLEARQLADAGHNRRQWESRLPILPALDTSMAKRTSQIARDENVLGAAIELRKKRHAAYEVALDEHDRALADVAAIRKIVQNSKLDDKSHKANLKAGGKKTATVAKVTAMLVEYKQIAHPRVHNVLALAETAVQQGGSGIDLIYRLLYQTRDALNLSKQKLIKSEQAAVGNWRTNKLAFRSDINQQRIIKATEYQRKGTVKREIGNFKKTEGAHLIRMGEAKKIKDLNQILKDFLEVACQEDRDIFSSTIALKRNEQAALIQVQKKLVTLKWSKKVYKAIKKVNEGVVYLKGAYNIKSGLDLFMASSKNTPQFAPKKTDAETFYFKLNEKDLSYWIIKKVKQKKGVDRQYFLSEHKNKVTFANSRSKAAQWSMLYDTKSGKMFIKNVATKNTLFVRPFLDAKKGYTLTTVSQTEDKRSEFTIERPNYKEVGCFKNQGGKQLQHYLGASNTINTGSCFRKCEAAAKEKAFKFDYFGLSEGKQCFCGTSFSKKTAPRTDCGYLCNGREGDLCGGAMRTLVYKVTSSRSSGSRSRSSGSK